MDNNLLTKFILSFLVEKQDYLELSTTQQQLVFETCKTIMTAIYNAVIAGIDPTPVNSIDFVKERL